MQIIIPMSGMGDRFKKAGYTDPKPLIKVDGKPIIEHVVNMFPCENDFVFICNQQHLAETPMRAELERIKPDAKIVQVAPHKLGPVYAVLQAADFIKDDEPCVVNYCDFSVYWDYADFKATMQRLGCEGCVTAYKGFHPHTLGTTFYAYMRWDKDNYLTEIREKEAYTDNRMQEYASSGTYYFKSGKILKKYFQETIDQQLSKGGEYYVSLVYNLLKRDSLRTYIYELEHFLQWGTPEELEEYLAWSNYFHHVVAWKKTKAAELPQDHINLIPMAGRGQRFADEGYVLPKPLIPVDGEPMVVQAVRSLPKAEQHVFVCLEEHLKDAGLKKVLTQTFPNSQAVTLKAVTEGQACTCLEGLKGFVDAIHELHLQSEGEEPVLQKPLVIGACDNGMLWNIEAYQQLLRDKNPDAVIWTFKKHPSALRNPKSYGWVKADATGKVELVKCKETVSQQPQNDHAVVGTFSFKSAQLFIDAAKAMIQKNIRVNNEFYVDLVPNELLAMGMSVYVFQIDYYVGWGTPNDYKTYNYWQSYFQKVGIL